MITSTASAATVADLVFGLRIGLVSIGLFALWINIIPLAIRTEWLDFHEPFYPHSRFMDIVEARYQDRLNQMLHTGEASMITPSMIYGAEIIITTTGMYFAMGGVHSWGMYPAVGFPSMLLGILAGVLFAEKDSCEMYIRMKNIQSALRPNEVMKSQSGRRRHK